MSTSALNPQPSALKILHVIPSLGPLRGGPIVVMHRMARDLAAQGLAVDVVATDDNGPGRQKVALATAQLHNGVTYRYFPRQTRFYTVSLPLARWLERHVADYDLLHIHALFSFASSAAIWAAQRRNVPYILRPLGTLNRYGMQQRRPLFKRISFALFERRALARAAAVHYTSEQEQREAATLGVAHRAVVIPLAVAPPPPAAASALRKRYPQLDGRTVVLFLGRIDQKKGLDLLLPAFAAAHARHPDLALLIAGDGEPAYRAQLQAIADRLGLTDTIIWAGFADELAKAELFAGADLFVLPSYSENFGIAVVEAMAAGLPVIISDQVAIHQLVGTAMAGRVVPCATAALAEALLELGTNRMLCREMGKAGQQAAREHFAPAAIAGQLSALYRTIVGTHHDSA